ncbi:hypothetical protein SVIOM74S_09683 [Streptomyces violarus]
MPLGRHPSPRKRHLPASSAGSSRATAPSSRTTSRNQTRAPGSTPRARSNTQGGYDPAYDPEQYAQWIAEQQQAEQYLDQPHEEPSPEDTGSFPIPVGPNRTRELGDGGGTPPAPEPDEESYYQVFRQSIDGSYPTPRALGDNIQATYGTTLSPSALKTLAERFQKRHTAELEEDHIA